MRRRKRRFRAWWKTRMIQHQRIRMASRKSSISFTSSDQQGKVLEFPGVNLIGKKPDVSGDDSTSLRRWPPSTDIGLEKGYPTTQE
jgi:hypothetical protein